MSRESKNPATYQPLRELPVTVKAQGHYLGLQLHCTPFVVGGDRGVVSEFSRQSRKRMLSLLARLDWPRLGLVCFVTLTYPDGNGSPATNATERDRQTFFKRLRRLHPRTSGIWRREWVTRKSGRYVGVEYPHYHLLLFNLPFLPHEDLNQIWREVIGWDGYVRTEIEGVKDYRRAIAYVSKYMAKPVEGASRTERGDCVGASNGCGNGGGDEGSGGFGGEPKAPDRSLVYSAYLTGEHRSPVGRAWGVFNRKEVPLARLERVRLPAGDWLDTAKQVASIQWPGVMNYPGNGFALFTDDPYAWLARIVELSGQDTSNDGDGDGAGTSA